MASTIDPQSLCVARVPLFSGLSDEELLEVASRATPLRRSRGEIIHTPSDDLAHLLVVHTGRVRISRVDASGAERLLRVLEPGDFIGEASFITGARPDHFATALEDIELCSFNHRELQGLVEAYPTITLQMLRATSTRLEAAEQFIADVTTTPVASRVASFIADLPRESGGVVRLPYAKKDVASLLGTTPETFSRQLAAFANAGILRTSGQTVTLLDEERLLAASHSAR